MELIGLFELMNFSAKADFFDFRGLNLFLDGIFGDETDIQKLFYPARCGVPD